MTDFQALAQARNLHLTASELARVAPVLEALESALAPLVASLRHDTEPALILSESAISPGF